MNERLDDGHHLLPCLNLVGLGLQVRVQRGVKPSVELSVQPPVGQFPKVVVCRADPDCGKRVTPSVGPAANRWPFRRSLPLLDAVDGSGQPVSRDPTGAPHGVGPSPVMARATRWSWSAGTTAHRCTSPAMAPMGVSSLSAVGES